MWWSKKKLWIGVLSRLRERAEKLTTPVAEKVAKAGISPDSLTFLGLVTGTISALLFAQENQLWGAVFLLLCGGLDAIDGAVARISGQVTRFGGVLDSTVDRYVDFFVIAGIVWGDPPEILGLSGWVWGFLALSGSLLVSYVRARAEAAGADRLDVGVAERGERLLILAFGGLIGLIGYALVIVAALSHITVIHRLVVAKRKLAQKNFLW